MNLEGSREKDLGVKCNAVSIAKPEMITAKYIVLDCGKLFVAAVELVVTVPFPAAILVPKSSSRCSESI
jgi:hypothetical protein